MAYGRIVVGGILCQAQRWSIGVNLSIGDLNVPSPAQMTTFAESVRALFDADVWSGAVSFKTLASSTATLDICHAYYSASGHVPPPYQVSGDSTGASVPGTTTRTFPPQAAIVATLRTDQSGRSARGRVYLPMGNGSFAVNTGTLSTSLAATATGLAAFLTAVNGSSLAGNTVSCSVQSNVTSTPTLLPIRRVTIDNVVDTQRRRRDKIVATVTAAGTV